MTPSQQSARDIVHEILNTHRTSRHLAVAFEKAMIEYANGKLEEANKIAEGWPCYHNLGACGPSIAENIRSLKEPLK